MLSRKKSAEEVWAEFEGFRPRGGWIDWLAQARRFGGGAYDDALYCLCRYAQHKGWPAIDPDAYTQASYVAQRLEGATHTFSEMVCLRTPPMSNTDREFLEGRGGCYDQFAGQHFVGDEYQRIARKNGVDTTGKVYLNGLARFPGDPEAWVTGRGDVQKRIEERGWSCQGAVNVKAREPDGPPAPDIDVADDILDQAVVGRIEANPDLAHVDQNRLREETKEKIKPHWA